MSDFQEQLIELQTRVAYQEDTLAQLNDVIARQDAELIQLKQQLRLIAQRLDELSRNPAQGDGEVMDERPPHY
ncbi:MAG TPA: SlyX family protein [Cellvibrio sp.]|jgi:SlyX protein|uniref:Protein SlyX homolog n=1 Tax=Cellvibrio mixtus TaxID=39650 RepID=A0A266Q3L5_9GAMM|nr:MULTISPECIES: SlyX family protein [Cellvibrio]AQT58961.1 homocysteine methyltransferase [Cellvibrio sp. PSBB023]OZY84450.1 homocysteine methyltransferase [Cellvibrio mixtus]